MLAQVQLCLLLPVAMPQLVSDREALPRLVEYSAIVQVFGLIAGDVAEHIPSIFPDIGGAKEIHPTKRDDFMAGVEQMWERMSF